MSYKIENLCKSFENKVIFDNFSYEFENTGCYVLSGASGIGKTTLLNIIAGLDKFYTGTVFSSPRTSYLFQEHRLFPTLNALDNAAISVYSNENRGTYDDARALLSELGFKDSDMLLYPDELSGGMAQRVALVRALLPPSDVLLLDEPTKELDSDLVKTVIDIISRVSKTKLVILSTHDDLSSLLPISGIITL